MAENRVFKKPNTQRERDQFRYQNSFLKANAYVVAV